MFNVRVGVVLMVLLAFAASVQAAETFKVDPVHAQAVFRVMHVGYANVIGRFNDISGEIVFDKDDFTKSKLQVTIKTTSVDTNFQKRDDHLRSPDFFNVKEFPEMTFTSTDIEKTGDQTGNVQGNLTLLGVTKPVTLAFTFNKLAPNPLKGYNQILTAGFSARTKIKRSDFGMKYGLKVIGDDIEIWLEAEAQKK